MPIPEITEAGIHHLASGGSLARGYEYYENGAVESVEIQDEAYIAHVRGSELYTVKIYEKDGEINAECTCPYDWGGVCKHTVAVMIAINHNKKIKEHEKKLEAVTSLLNKVNTDRQREFLLQALTSSTVLLENFKIFASGKEETKNTSEDYKKEILLLFEELEVEDTERYYDDYDDYDDYHDPYEQLISEIIDEFIETAQKYASQENYKEAIKIYQGICDACIEGLENERLTDFHDDMRHYIPQALHAMAENIQKLCVSSKDKEPYLDYLLQVYGKFEDKMGFNDVFQNIINAREDADYVLNKHGIDFTPPITLNLLIVKGEAKEVFLFGEKHYKEYPEMAIHLAEFYKQHNQRENAIAVAEKAIKIIQNKRKDFYYDFSLSDPLKELREFLDKHYDYEADYPKIIENLMALLILERDIGYYKRLKKIIRTEQERLSVIERLEKLLGGEHDLLFRIYSIENDHEKMLNLAKKSIQFDVFHSIVKNIRSIYPEKCFELYKEKIDKYTEEVKKRGEYRRIAYWLKLMKEVPGTQDEFRGYIQHLRDKYRRRSAFIEEIKDV